MGLIRAHLVLFIAGCGGVPEHLADCEGSACALRWIEARIEDDSETCAREVLALPAGIEREALVQLMVERWPGRTTALCAALPEGAGRARCQAVNSRPHLWQVDERDPDKGPMGAGRAFPTLRVAPGSFDHPWMKLAPLAPDCPDAALANDCHEHAADRAAQEGRFGDAWRICLDVPAGKWRDECFFEASEGAFAPGGHGGPGPAAEICMGSGLFVDRCLGHLAGKLGRAAPVASWPAPERWQALEVAAQRVHETLAPYDADLARRWVGLMWAEAMATAYAPVDQPAGDPLDHVGAWAVPHARAAAAWSLWRVGGERGRDLGEWADLVLLSLEQRGLDPALAPAEPKTRDLGSQWERDLPGEEALPWVPYRGSTTRRALAEDPASDAAICVLEAAARQPTQRSEALLAQGLRHPDRLVRWTAARLSSDLAPRVLADLDPAAEPDPLVRMRLVGASEP